VARPFAGWRERRRLRQLAWHIYRQAVEQARRPGFYAAGGVPDTVEGRFELMTLHVLLLWRWLQRQPGEGAALAQAVVDAFFTDLDRNLREMGVGDLSVGKHVKRIAGSFLARTRDLSVALDAGDRAAIAAILARNLGWSEAQAAQAAALARYALDQDAALREHGLAQGEAPAPLFAAAPFAGTRGDARS